MNAYTHIEARGGDDLLLSDTSSSDANAYLLIGRTATGALSFPNNANLVFQNAFDTEGSQFRSYLLHQEIPQRTRLKPVHSHSFPIVILLCGCIRHGGRLRREKTRGA